MSAPPLSVYQFGDFHLDVEERLLSRRDGTAVPLTPRVFETLRYLVEHSGRVLDKEVLMEAVWPDCIVEENNLAQNISTLRRAFGESPGSQRYIVTVPGRGYRFVPEVRQRKNGDSPEAERESDPPSAPATTYGPARPDAVGAEPPARRQILRPILLTALTLLALGAAVFFLWGRRTQTPIVAPASVAPPALAILEKSIAVLPFENQSDDIRNAYFAAAVQDEILSNLARLADLKVISRTSASLYKTGNPRNVREIGQQLGVAHLLEGSVQHSGNRVRVTAQLIDARTDAHLWAQTYDREVADVLAIQSEIASAIADQLKAKISPGEKARLDLKPTENAEAYVLYLRGREIETRFRAELAEFKAAINFYEQARDLDPAFALARARLSILISHTYQGNEPTRKEQARAEAEEALRLRPDLGEAQLALAYTYFRGTRDYDRALVELERARQMLPNSAEVPLTAAYIYKWQNKFRERIAALQRAETLDPRHPQVSRLLFITLRWVRDWPEAIRTYDRMRALQPDDPALRFESWRAQDDFRRTGDIEVLKKANAIDLKAGAELDQGRLNAWLYQTADLERDFAAAERFLAQAPAKLYGSGSSSHPKLVHEALLAVARGTDPAAAERALNSARQEIETQLAPFAEVGSAETLDWRANLALLYAFLGRKEDAIREARHAIEIERGEVEKNYAASALALIYARTGQPEEAIDLIEHLLTVPIILGRGAVYNLTLTDLKWRWVWDPLRSNPRFQKILSSPEPKTVY
jgi:TolB-like protein/DNA-binding winged helix-turn-helix (wHTH) protein/Tfp pilus assembly protein PilF